MLNYLLIFSGSALGGMARHFVGGAVARRSGEWLPWGTLTVNVSGCLVIGFFALLAMRTGSVAMHRFFVVGLCGGYTTFSSLSLQTLYLARERNWPAAFMNILLSVGLCLAAVALGAVLGHWVSDG
ncbi:MAG TPA: fluoride efflux transporter CrcB [Stellaceae bacterium]|nr:fluoride efflux transporter CrcB [Stellaceae bacterium]